MPRKKEPRCEVGACDRIATESGKTLCKRCYVRLRHQTAKGITWMMRRLQTLDMWESGIEGLLGTQKVTRIKKRRAA